MTEKPRMLILGDDDDQRAVHFRIIPAARKRAVFGDATSIPYYDPDEEGERRSTLVGFYASNADAIAAAEAIAQERGLVMRKWYELTRHPKTKDGDEPDLESNAVLPTPRK